MRWIAICFLFVAFSGCISDGETDPDTTNPGSGGQNGSGALPTNEGGGQALPVEEADPETRGEPTREESGTETVLQPTPGSQKTVTYTHSMLSVANVLLDVQGDIHVEPATGSEYEISFVLWTPAVGPAAEFMFDQYELVFEDDLADNVLHVEALSTLKPDSPFACQTVGGLSTCIGNPPATVSIVAKLPASFLNLTADANLGDVTIVDQAGAAVEAGTNTGDVRVSGSFANLDLETNTGSVHMDGAGGDLEAHSNSGNINVEGTFENVSMSTNQGDLTGTIAANVLSLDTNQGTATVDWTPVGASEFHHDGNSGNLDLTLPPGAYRLELETNLGDADVDARFQSKGEGVWETEGFESAAVKNYVYSDLNTGSQSVHS